MHRHREKALGENEEDGERIRRQAYLSLKTC